MLQGILYRGKITNLHPQQWPSWILSNPALWSRGAGLRFLRGWILNKSSAAGVFPKFWQFGAVAKDQFERVYLQMEKYQCLKHIDSQKIIYWVEWIVLQKQVQHCFFSERHRTCPSALRCPCKIKLQQGPGWVGVHSSSCCLHVFSSKNDSISLSLSTEAPACVTIVPPIKSGSSTPNLWL